ncbi:MAG TPA: hypothetical protein VFB38_16710 [Chthonomonadaceae bacterium]|nr:hypothetical protein [Chthonomonadaceae bacterium]
MQNPLEAYRRTQRELRRHFEAFTRENCPTCPTPCCVRPARILPTDILLAEATGWKALIAAPPGAAEPDSAPDIVAEVAGRMAEALGKPPESAEADTVHACGQPCEFLGEHGCTFPPDLRPFGCTAYICRYMYAKLDRQSLSRIKRLVRELEEKHNDLLRTIRPVSWQQDPPPD